MRSLEMTRSWIGLLLAAVVCGGFGIGAGIGLFSPLASVRAGALSESEVESIYRELDMGGSPLEETSRSLSRIARVVMPSVVHINSTRRLPSRRVEETGSGVVMHSSKRAGTYIVTNRHVIIDALPELDTISIHIQDGRVLHPRRVWEDRYSDVAVMEVDAPDLRPLRWGDSDELQIGNLVLACGSPFGLSQSMTLGIISARGRSSLGIGRQSGVLNQDFLQTDAAINPGNSGGPLIDLRGRLVGINTAIASTHGGNEGIGFSIPSNLVQHVVDELLEHGEVPRAYLGVKLDSEFGINVARQLRLDKLRGARVLEVYANTPAAKAQFRFNDVILLFDGREVLDESHLINLVSLSDVGRAVEVVIWRDGSRVTLKVDLTDRPVVQR